VNLLSNAVKYNREGGLVRVSARPAPEDFVAIAVEDSGIGVRSQDLRRLFEPFVRLDANHSQPGSGIGLTISRRLVEAMSGRIEAKSEPGHGSTFTVLLPPGMNPAQAHARRA